MEIDAERQVARIVGGTLWGEVVAAATPHGLTALHGSAHDVAVAGYALSGGLSFYARQHGLATHSILAAEVVTADGSVVRATAEDNPDLFWALRGGGGNFGAVVALELRLLPVADVVAGMLLWPMDRAPEVTRTWLEWTRELPDSVSTTLRLMSFPPLPELPPFLSGRQHRGGRRRAAGGRRAGRGAAGRAAGAGPGDGHLRPDPRGRAAGGAHGPAGPQRRRCRDTPCSVPSTTQLSTHCSRRWARARPRRCCSPSFGTSAAQPVDRSPVRRSRTCPGPTHCSAARSRRRRRWPPRAAPTRTALVEAMAPWAETMRVLTLTETVLDTATGVDAESWARLREVRAEVDPAGVFLANHEIS